MKYFQFKQELPMSIEELNHFDRKSYENKIMDTFLVLIYITMFCLGVGLTCRYVFGKLNHFNTQVQAALVKNYARKIKD